MSDKSTIQEQPVSAKANVPIVPESVSNTDFVPFEERKFVGDHIRSTETASIFPDNRPVEPRVFVTSAIKITPAELDDEFHKLHTPWKPQAPCYTVKDWRRSVVFRTLPQVPKPSDISLDLAADKIPKQQVFQRKSTRTKTPYLSVSPRLKTPGRPKASFRRSAKRTPRSRRIVGKNRVIAKADGDETLASALHESSAPKSQDEQKEKGKQPVIEDLESQSEAELIDGKPLLAVENQQKAVHLALRTFGPSSQRVRKSCEKLIVLCNSIAMSLIKGQRSETAYDLLERALNLTRRTGPLQRHKSTRQKLQAATLNNIGCYWKNCREYGHALRYLKKASELEAKTMGLSTEAESPARTHLNLCSVLSALGRHTQALDHARVAKKVLEIDQIRFIKSGGSDKEALRKFSQLHIVALHNMAVEEMWLFRFEKARMVFEQALVALTKLDLPEGSRLKLEICEGLEEAKTAQGRVESSVARVRKKKELRRQNKKGVTPRDE